MVNLHVHYIHGNVKAFRQELDGNGSAASLSNKAGAGSLGKSWNGLGTLSGPSGKGDANERDSFGRT